jgi:competence protein ComEC
MQTETVEAAEQGSALRVGVRVNVYGKTGAGNCKPDLRYGDRVKFPARLNLPRNFRNPGAFDYQGYLAQNGIQAIASVKIQDVQILPGFSGNRAEAFRCRIHRSVLEKIHTLWPAADSGLMEAMVIGEDSFLNRSTRVNFQRSGTYHVLVVSGMNISILALFTFWLLRNFRMPDLLASLVALASILGYAILTDEGSPVWRATLMFAVYLGARLLFRERSVLNAIGAAALGVMVFDPQSLFGASFQLTFLCVLLVAGLGMPLLERTVQPYATGISKLEVVNVDYHLAPKVAQFRLDLRMIAGRIRRFIPSRFVLPLIGINVKLMLGALQLLIMSAVLQIGLALPMAYYFHRATLMSVPANLLVIPLMQLLMPAAAIAVAASYFWMPLARPAAWIATWAAKGIAGTVYWLGGSPVADVRIPTPSGTIIICTAVALGLAMLLARRRALYFGLGLATLAAAAFWAVALPPRPSTQPGSLEVTAIDVGQGDSILLIGPNGKTLLMDAGGLPSWTHSEMEIGEDVVSPYLWARGFSHLDVVALSHAHWDHAGGMLAVLRNFKPRELWLTEGSLAAPELQPLLEQARISGVRILVRSTGNHMDWDGVSVSILAPDPLPAGRSVRPNDDSMVMKVVYSRTSALLEGDAERATEQEIASQDVHADLLKVAHHGSATSTIPSFLAAVRPRYAVISVGTHNVYGHPRLDVLDRLGKAGVETYRTDLNGATSFYLNGAGVSSQPADRH